MSTPETAELLAERYGESYRWWIALTVLIGMVSAVVTTTIVNVAIPDIMGAFGIGQDVAHWLSTGALAGTTVAMLIQAWLMVRFGPRRTFIGALIVFVAALLVAGFAPNEFILILARVVQGAVAGMLQPIAVYMLFRVFPSDRKGQAMGMFGLVAILGPALGPAIGGLMIEQFNWRYVFFIAIPPAVAAMFLASVFLPQHESRDESTPKQKSFDWLAFGLVSLSLGCFLVALSNGQRDGWNSNSILMLVLIALASGTVFVTRELRSEAPLVDLRPLGNSQFVATAVLTWIFGASLFGSIYLVPLFVQTVQGFTPLKAGLLLMPGGLILCVAMPLSGYLADRMPARGLILTGISLCIVSSFWMAGVDVNTPFWAFAWVIALGRIGLALVQPSLNVAALSALPAQQLGHTVGLINFFRQLGGACGVSLLAVALDRRLAFHSDAITAMQASSNATADLLRNVQGLLARAGASVDLQAQGAIYYLGQVISAQSYSLAFRDSFYVVAFAFVLALAPAWVVGSTNRKVPATGQFVD